MRTMKVPLAVLTLTACLFLVRTQTIPEGYNDNINWFNLVPGLQESKESKKPVLMMFVMESCVFCKQIAPKFAASEEIEELSKEFVMIIVEKDSAQDTKDKKYQPEGVYFPRILFLDVKGNVYYDVYNYQQDIDRKNGEFKHFYPEAEYIIRSMKEVLQYHKEGKEAAVTPENTTSDATPEVTEQMTVEERRNKRRGKTEL